jgi:oxygen-independent coproporphyrinogen-3 oxidase
MSVYSIYIHIPFCQKRCSYCDFNTYTGRDSLIPEYIQALVKEIKFLGLGVNEAIPAHTVYFGGGTPSLIPPDKIYETLSTLDGTFSFITPMEITLEANPGTVSLPYLKDLRSMRLNRISLGVQSTHPRELALLGRQHDFIDVMNAVRWIRQAGFDNLSLDLIFGTPGQTTANWEKSLRMVIDLNPDHLSLYELTIETDTPMHYWYSRGLIPPINPDLAAEMYEIACEYLECAGYLQYEISNWSRSDIDKRTGSDESRISNTSSQTVNQLAALNVTNPAFSCQHNLQCWRNLPYLGFGAGAHGFANGYRTANVLRPEDYIHRIDSSLGSKGFSFPQSPANSDLKPIDRETEIRESMMMGLRLTIEGISESQFYSRFGISLRERFGEEISKIIRWGLLEWVGERLRLTSKGRLLGNKVFVEFI